MDFKGLSDPVVLFKQPEKKPGIFSKLRPPVTNFFNKAGVPFRNKNLLVGGLTVFLLFAVGLGVYISQKPTQLIPHADYSPTTSGTLIYGAPNPCILGSNNTCATTIFWNGSGKPDIKVTIRESGGALFAAGPSGQATAPWINSTGITFDLYSGTTLMDSAFVIGIPFNPEFPNYKGNIRTNPSGTCTLNANGTCTVKVIWDVSNVYHAGITTEIKIRETGASFLPKADVVRESADAPWINASGYHFDLYVDNQLYDSIFIKGVSSIASPSPSPSTVSSPSPSPSASISPSASPSPSPSPSPATSPSPSPSASPSSQTKGDGNNDGVIDLTDLSIMLNSWSPAVDITSHLELDFNNDGRINSLDHTAMRDLLLERGVIRQ